MNSNTITEVKRPTATDEIPRWQEGYAYLAGGTWLFSTPQIATHTLIDLETLRWPALKLSSDSVLEHRRHLHHRRARAIPGAGELERGAAAQTLLPRAADVVQDL